MSIEILFSSDARHDEWVSPFQYDHEEFLASAYALGNYGSVHVAQCDAFPWVEHFTPEQAAEALEAYEELDSYESVEEITTALEEVQRGHGWSFDDVIELLGEWSARVSKWDSEGDYAKYWLSEVEEGRLPDHLERHFNYASYGEELVSERESLGDVRVDLSWGEFFLITPEA